MLFPLRKPLVARRSVSQDCPTQTFYCSGNHSLRGNNKLCVLALLVHDTLQKYRVSECHHCYKVCPLIKHFPSISNYTDHNMTKWTLASIWEFIKIFFHHQKIVFHHSNKIKPTIGKTYAKTAVKNYIPK
uniref:Uncharacterized protein n=2 Tax=Anguilla anguilla TaxID=7936 RepID=A0A0E9UJA5_ANGAN